MVESLCGGLFIGLLGFGFWSYDIGGFENIVLVYVYKCWCVFGLFFSYSCLYGSKFYWVLWVYDDEFCDVVCFFIEQKCWMMLYLYWEVVCVNEVGMLMMWVMMLEFLDDLVCDYFDCQYMLGDVVMVVLVFSEVGDVEFYLLEGCWMYLWCNDEVQGSCWYKQQYDFLSLLVYVCDNILLVLGNNSQKFDYVWYEGMVFQLFYLDDGCEVVCEVFVMDGLIIFMLQVKCIGNIIMVSGEGKVCNWMLCLCNIMQISGIKCDLYVGSELGVVVILQGNEVVIMF